METEQDIFNKLTVLIVKYPKIQTWIFKVNDEFNGRGTATFSLENIRALNEML